MKNLTAAVAALLTSAAIVHAGGLDRSGQGVGVIFNDGNYVELSFGRINPTVSGTYSGGVLQSGNIAQSYHQASFGYTHQINKNLSFALISDQPFGANVDYPATGTFPALVGMQAEFSSTAFTAMARYKLGENFSVHAGVKQQTVEMSVSIPAVALLYTATGAPTSAYGYVLGAAYEIPEIALRAALTYHSATKYDIATEETSSTAPPGGISSVTSITMPRAVNLDFQTGIAADTLLTAGIRWANWTQTDIAPTYWAVSLGNGSLQSYSQDVFTYSLGIGRRFTENLAGSVTIAHEAAQGGTAGNLAPTDGFTSISVGGAYTMDNIEVSGGVRYVRIGDATSAGVSNVNGTFSGNSALGVGVKVGLSF
ncbi:MAG: hypothetical protein JJ894_13125 [Dinoroseobacter sp.]|nr:hypothetical protein [Dinoroseobacter sp.]